MKNTEHFRTAAFGGFQKEDVLEFIENLANDHERKCEALYETISEIRKEKEVLQAHCANAQTKVKQALVQMQSAKKELGNQKEEHKKILEEKEAAFQQIRLQNQQLVGKNKMLEEKIQELHNLREQQQGSLQLKEQTAREKTRSMIRQAKALVESEYHQRMEEAGKEADEKIALAKEKAEEIITEASVHAKDILKQTQLEVAEVIEEAKIESAKIVEKANITAKNILLKAAEKATSKEEKHRPELGKTRERANLELDHVKQFIHREVGDALRSLDTASASVQTTRSKVAGIRPTPKEEKGKVKKTLRDFLN